jgi:predicted ester cyclase
MTASSVEDNKAVMRYIVERNDARDSYAYLGKVAEDFVGHHHFIPDDLHGNRSLSDFFYVTEAMSFPDGSHTIHKLFGEGEFVALELSFVGTFTADLPIGIPANGKEISFQYSIICRFSDSKLAELWWYPLDSYRLMQELGMLKQ